jgi:adsorption protein B
LAEALYLLLACWMIVSGLDDLWQDCCFLIGKLPRGPARRDGGLCVPPEGNLAELGEQWIALWIPAWREDEVIARMVAHNVGSIRYGRYHIFAGTYPNDDATLDVLRVLEDQYPNLHVSLTPHAGPTSKGDNMNWIYQNMCEVEERLGQRFDIVVVHDSEDLIHPEEFRWLNYYTREFDFVQIPVLALPTPWWEFTHGVYCDEFAETQQKDQPTRNRMGGFSPSCGVGTGYRREALERLAVALANRLFEPDSLTEDYLNGLRMHRLGMRQIYLPVEFVNGQPVATREYFPQRFRAAVRQRSRWVTGIALQTWQKVGWGRSWSERYWFFRDRKGLVGNPLSLVANGLVAAVMAGWRPDLSGVVLGLSAVGLLLQCVRIGFRVWFTARIYGLAYACLVPLRIPWSNLINTLATWSALRRYAVARWRREPLIWLKTEHAYPNRAALKLYRRKLGEVLVDLGMVEAGAVEEALAAKAERQRLGEHLVERGLLGWDQLYEALGVLSGYPVEEAMGRVDARVARCLPRGLMAEGSLLPLRREGEVLLIATSEVPSEHVLAEVRRFVKGESQFVLVPPGVLEGAWAS